MAIKGAYQPPEVLEKLPMGRTKPKRYSMREVIRMIGDAPGQDPDKPGDNMMDIISMLVNKAQAGNLTAAMFLVDKITPARPQHSPLPDDLVLEGDTPLEKLESLQDQMAGRLSAPEISAITGVLQAQQEFLNQQKLDKLEADMAELKALIANPQGNTDDK